MIRTSLLRFPQRLRRAVRAAGRSGMALSLGLASLALGAHADSPDAELGALRAEVAELRGALNQREATIAQLRTQTALQAQTLAEVKNAVALARGRVPAPSALPESPSSTLDWSRALQAATAANLMVPGAGLLTVMPTGSMEPIFNERAILLVEPARFDDLKVGDIVTYRHPRFDLVVVHRLIEKRGDKFWSKGDHNGQADSVYVTRANYGARVYGIIYAREPSAAAQRYTAALATP